MNKSKLSLSLVTSFIAAMAMSACGNKVTSDPNAIVTLTGYDGNEISVVTDDVYYDYLKSSSGISKFYDAMLEVLIRYEYSNENSVLWKEKEQPKRTYSQVENFCKQTIKDMKKTAKDTGNYSDEWKKKLEENGVEDEKELLQKLIYDEEKSNVIDWYFRVNESELLKEYIGLAQGEAAAAYPYHIRHILANVSSGASDFYNGTISESEALKLYTIAIALKEGKETFGEIAVAESGDTGSAVDSKGTIMNGSLGIMDRSTSFVNEFKLGLYAYDAIYSGRAAVDTADVEEGLAMSNYRAELENIGLSYVPYKVFERLYEFKDTDKDDTGHQVNEGNSKYYKSGSKETKCSYTEYSSGMLILQLTAYIQHAFTGSYHIIYYDYIFSVHVITEEFMCNNRVLSVYNLCVVTSLVEHSHINTEVVSKVNSSVHSTFIRAYYHHMISIQLQVRSGFEKTFDELICWHEILKTNCRNCILHTWVMCITCNNVLYTH